LILAALVGPGPYPSEYTQVLALLGITGSKQTSPWDANSAARVTQYSGNFTVQQAGGVCKGLQFCGPWKYRPA